MQRILFFIGKGGVGKSTLSAVTAVALAGQNKNIVLTSLDPAHNQSDLFQIPFSENPSTVLPNLQVIEIDSDKWIRSYLKRAEEQFQAAYAYLTTFSLEKYFSVIRNAPGIEAYALMMAFEHICKKYTKADYLIFDMPPTALTLSFFALPGVSLLWLDKLLQLRKEIAEKEKIISTLRLGKKVLERDRVMQNINRQIKHWSELNAVLSADNFKAVVVKNSDVLSQAETARILTRLADLQIKSPFIFNNKADGLEVGNSDFDFCRGENLIGLEKIKSYCLALDVGRLQKFLEWNI